VLDWNPLNRFGRGQGQGHQLAATAAAGVRTAGVPAVLLDDDHSATGSEDPDPAGASGAAHLPLKTVHQRRPSLSDKPKIGDPIPPPPAENDESTYNYNYR
jgi:hypothetical protein